MKMNEPREEEIICITKKRKMDKKEDFFGTLKMLIPILTITTLVALMIMNVALN